MSDIDMTHTISIEQTQIQRSDLKTIINLIPEGASVLDLGCGSGRLLKALKQLRGARVMGVEIDEKKIIQCAERGVPVIQANLDRDIAEIPNNSFDYVILSQTIQAVMRPDMVLGEMIRIGKHCIVSFINFGHISSRVELLRGNMPVTGGTLQLPWYNTPNIHPGTIADFRRLCRQMGVKIHKQIPLSQSGDILPSLAALWPNLFAPTCIFIIGK